MEKLKLKWKRFLFLLFFGLFFISFTSTQLNVTQPNITNVTIGCKNPITGEIYCGVKSPSGCWCDDLCVKYGDCCSDYQEVCAVNITKPKPKPNITNVTIP